MVAISRIISLCGLVGLVLAGCNSGTGRWIGTYEGMRAVNGDPKTDPVAFTVAHVKLELLENGRVHLLDGGMTFSGKWRGRSDGVQINLDQVLDQPIETLREADLKKAGERLMFVDPQGRDPSPVEMKLETQRPD